jgi:hypothetical protein
MCQVRGGKKDVIGILSNFSNVLLKSVTCPYGEIPSALVYAKLIITPSRFDDLPLIGLWDEQNIRNHIHNSWGDFSHAVVVQASPA